MLLWKDCVWLLVECEPPRTDPSNRSIVGSNDLPSNCQNSLWRRNSCLYFQTCTLWSKTLFDMRPSKRKRSGEQVLSFTLGTGESNGSTCGQLRNSGGRRGIKSPDDKDQVVDRTFATTQKLEER